MRKGGILRHLFLKALIETQLSIKAESNRSRETIFLCKLTCSISGFSWKVRHVTEPMPQSIFCVPRSVTRRSQLRFVATPLLAGGCCETSILWYEPSINDSGPQNKYGTNHTKDSTRKPHGALRGKSMFLWACRGKSINTRLINSENTIGYFDFSRNQ